MLRQRPKYIGYRSDLLWKCRLNHDINTSNTTEQRGDFLLADVVPTGDETFAI